MSDQLVVEREGLEKKDKSELQAIVSALGGRPGSRARKADLIDMILDLSGATARVADGDPGAEAPEDTDAEGLWRRRRRVGLGGRRGTPGLRRPRRR